MYNLLIVIATGEPNAMHTSHVVQFQTLDEVEGAEASIKTKEGANGFYYNVVRLFDKHV